VDESIAVRPLLATTELFWNAGVANCCRKGVIAILHVKAYFTGGHFGIRYVKQQYYWAIMSHGENFTVLSRPAGMGNSDAWS